MCDRSDICATSLPSLCSLCSKIVTGLNYPEDQNKESWTSWWMEERLVYQLGILYIHLYRLVPASLNFSNYITQANNFLVSEPFILRFNSQVKKKKGDKFQQCERDYPKGLINSKKIIQILNVLIKSCWILTVIFIQGLFYCLELPVQGTVTLSLLINCTASTKWLRSESNLVLQKCLDWHKFHYHQPYEYVSLCLIHGQFRQSKASFCFGFQKFCVCRRLGPEFYAVLKTMALRNRPWGVSEHGGW